MTTMSTIPLLALLLTCTMASTRSLAKPPVHKLGDHPAVVVQRLQAHKGYDYAAQFYPHPAWLYLRAAPSDAELSAKGPIAPLDEHPAAPAIDGATAAVARVDVE